MSTTPTAHTTLHHVFDRVLLSALMVDLLKRSKAEGANPKEMVETLVVLWRERCYERVEEELREMFEDQSEDAKAKRLMLQLTGGAEDKMRADARENVVEAERSIREWMGPLLDTVMND